LSGLTPNIPKEFYEDKQLSTKELHSISHMSHAARMLSGVDLEYLRKIKN
jgi:hypothetical protein